MPHLPRDTPQPRRADMRTSLLLGLPGCPLHCLKERPAALDPASGGEETK